MKPYGWRMGANEIGERGRVPVMERVVLKVRARAEAAAEMRKLLDEIEATVAEVERLRGRAA